jgi:hypothetical protein
LRVLTSSTEGKRRRSGKLNPKLIAMKGRYVEIFRAERSFIELSKESEDECSGNNTEKRN